MSRIREKGFRDLLAEHRYRRRFLADDVRLATHGLLAVVVFQLVLLVNDWLLHRGTPRLAWFVAYRSLVTLFALGVVGLLRATRRPIVFDVVVCGSWMLMVASALALTFDRARSGELVGPSIIMVAGTVLIYFSHQASIWAKVVPALVASVGGVLLLRGPLGSLSQVAPNSFVLAFVTLNLVGIYASRSFERHRRRLFEAEREARRARGALSAKVDELCARVSELADEKARVEDLARARTGFLAMMSHELRTPMNAVIGLSELLADRSLPPDAAEEATTIRDSARALLRVVNDILDHAKLDAGKVDLLPVPFDLRALLSSVTAMMQPLARSKGLSFELRVGDEVPSSVVGDEGRLRQVLVNLASNSIKFTSQGGVTLQVSARREGTLHAVDVRVCDTGIGIAEGAIDRIFKPYEQADATTSRRFGGTGLGLPICKQIVELMGGRIDVSSTPGQGSTFSFSVLLGPAAEQRFGADVEVHIQGLRLLVVDDNPVNLKVATAILGRLGYQADTVLDAPSALEAIERERFDLVFVDMQLPGMSGLDLAREIRRTMSAGRGPRLVAMTANAFDEDRRACLAAGMDDFIAKPIDVRMLCAAMQRAAVAWSSNARQPGETQGARPAVDDTQQAQGEQAGELSGLPVS